MSQSERACSTKFLCDYLGISRQGYYKHTDRKKETDVLRTSIVLYCKSILSDKLPHAGMRELYSLCCDYFADKMTIGRDQCFQLFRANGLVRRKTKRPRTTNSNHNYYIYPDLLNTTPKLVAKSCGELMVSDITYVATATGWAYLSLITDAATRLIVGYALHPTLETEGPMKALNMALAFYHSHNIHTENLIHHSDRGIQYCSNKYVQALKQFHIQISMTQTGDPLHNALAERMNCTIKYGWLIDTEHLSFEEMEKKIAFAVKMYNTVRPHQALAMKAPMRAFLESL